MTWEEREAAYEAQVAFLASELSEAEVAEAEARCRAASPAPWVWREDQFNNRIAAIGRTGKRRAKPGRTLRECFVFALTGGRKGGVSLPESELDPYDYHGILYLRWYELRGSLFHHCPPEQDRDFIAAARSDLPRALATIKALRARIAELESR